MEDVTSQLEAIASLKDDIKQRNEELHAMTRRLRQLVVELSETEDRERQRLADLLHDDLQQMLAGVVFHIDLAESKCRGNREAVGLLANANTLLKDVITKARDVSHELSPAPFHTQGMEGGLTWLADQMYRQHGLDVDLRVNGNVDEMAASIQILVYKAIREMLFNIVKHAGVDHANVRIVREPAHVEVTVQDHGEGFDAEAVLDNKSQHGLGLFSIRERLDVLGGRLDVESTRGEGSRFRLMVPLVQKDIEDAAEQTRRRSDEADGQIPDHPPDQTISIVVVDDHEVVREGITRILQDRPEMVVLANVESGWQAIEVVNESEPDVVLMDYSMPDMDGIETTRRIAAEHPDVRIIGLSMYDEADIADQMLRAGASAFVEKTAPASQLLATIMAVNDGDSIASSTD
jgi:CheY-like chemotaxis protein